MKDHVIICLKCEDPHRQPPHWLAQLDTSRPQSSFIDSVDRLFDRHGLLFSATSEYAPANGSTWSAEERKSGLNRVYRLILRENKHIPCDLVNSITMIPEVSYARTGSIATTTLPKPGPEGFSRQTDNESRDVIKLPQAHRFTKGDDSILIAVLDTGISLHHPEYRLTLEHGFDFVNVIDGAEKFFGDYLDADPIPEDKWVGHGSHVTGIIAGAGINMPSGVAPNCRILPIRVLGAMKQANRFLGAGLVDNINVGVKYAVDKGAQIINMSLGVRHEGGGLPHKEVVDYAQQKGVSIIAAAGNDGTNMVYYPSGHPYVITVGAVDESGQVAQFSTYGQHIDLVAPGTDIYSSYLQDRYAFSSGTSHAAPFVSGAVALLKAFCRSKGKRLSDSHIKYILKRSTDKIGKSFKDIKAGYGRLNLLDAMILLEHKMQA